MAALARDVPPQILLLPLECKINLLPPKKGHFPLGCWQGDAGSWLGQWS